jgi:SAM-dependent methyltransferase
MSSHDIARVRADFDQIASFGHQSGVDRYDAFLLSLVPSSAVDVLEVGCGSGRFAAAMAGSPRKVVGLDLSPAMIDRARRESSPLVSFTCGEFLAHEFNGAQFDCLVTAAALHHMPMEPSIRKMVQLLRPGGRLIVHDLRRDDGVADSFRAYLTLGHHLSLRFIRTGLLRSPSRVRAAWLRHGRDEHYLSWREVERAADALLPKSRVFYHWMWRYTIVWDKP